MVLKKLELRGAIGLYLGMGIEETDIDFGQFAPGLVLIQGPNGVGKSTLIENMQPFRQMVSHDDSFVRNFYLPDSYRKLTFEMGGDLYESIILMNPTLSQPKSEAYLYRNGEPVNEGGKTGTYDEAMVEVMGAPDMFFRALFSSQNGKRIADLKTGEKKELFIRLLGLDRYDKYLNAAKERERVVAMQRENLLERFRAIEQEMEGLADVSRAKQAALDDMVLIDEQLKTIWQEIEVVEQGIAKGAAALENDNVVKARIDDVTEEIKEMESRIDGENYESGERITELDVRLNGIETQLLRKRKVAENRDMVEAKVLELDALEAEILVLQTKANEYSDIRRRIEQLTNEHGRCERGRALLREVPCDEFMQASCPLAKNALDDLKKMAELCHEIETEQIKAEAVEYDDDRHKKVRSLIEELKAKPWRELKAELVGIEREIAMYEQQRNELAQERIDLIGVHDEKSQELVKALDEKREIMRQLQSKLMTNISEEVVRLQGQLTDMRVREKSIQKGKWNMEKRIAICAEKLERLEELQSRRGEIESAIMAREKTEEEWNTLASAVGKNGIQALEIDLAGPGITKVANDLLKSCFDSDFCLNFVTTKLKSDNKSFKEVFDIEVYRSGYGKPVLVDNLSGGERVWVTEALEEAIGVYLRESGGGRVMTCFYDESDGRLDPTKKWEYYKMRERVHALSGFHHTFLITHDPMIQRQIEQRIILDPKDGVECLY